MGTSLRSTSDKIVVASVVGAVFPDLDVIAARTWSVTHHAWPTHWPITWLLLASGLAPLLVTPATRPWAALGLAFVGNAFLHLVLDSVVGDVRWLAPWSQHSWTLLPIAHPLRPWWLNNVLHPTFALELALVGAAALRYRSRSRDPRTG